MAQHTIRTSILSSEETKQLQENLIGMIVIGIVVIIFFSFAFSILPNEKSVLIAFGIVGLFFAIVIGRQILFYIKDITGEEKRIIRGTITDRRLRFLRRSTRSTAYIYFDDIEIPVNFEHYNMVKTGDTVEVHYAPHTENSFLMIPISQSGFIRPRRSERRNEVTIIESEEPLTSQDKNIIIRFFRRRLIFLGLVFLFASYLMAGLILNGMYAILIFIFPIPILFIAMIYFILKNIIKMFADLRAKMKISIQTYLFDKSTIRRRAKDYHFIKTDAMEIQVNQGLYDKLETNQNVILKLSSIHRVLLSVITEDGEEIVNA